ncbi:trypsin domain-containing protein [Phthorimaea operculella]|nr:trypsin domain-containing protein [Phthorimaea operculella]
MSLLLFSSAHTFQNATESTEIQYDKNEVKSLRRAAIIGGEVIVFRVVNGEAAELGEFPYQVALMSQKKRQNYSATCGGTIISPRKIITAAHCLQKFAQQWRRPSFGDTYTIPGKAFGSKFLVVAGQLKKNAKFKEEGQWRHIRFAKYPRNYDFPVADIATMILKKAFKFDEFVSSIPYASRSIDYKKPCMLSGYGRESGTGDKIHGPNITK